MNNYICCMYKCGKWETKWQLLLILLITRINCWKSFTPHSSAGRFSNCKLAVQSKVGLAEKVGLARIFKCTPVGRDTGLNKEKDQIYATLLVGLCDLEATL